MSHVPEKLGPWVRLVGLLVLLVALAARAVVLRQAAETVHFANPILDAQTNWATARAWALGDGPTRPFFKAPLYPWLLGQGIRALRPLGVPEAEIAAWAIIGQHLLGILTAMVAWHLATRLAGGLAGLIAGLTAASAGVLIFYEGELLDTTLVTALLLLGVVPLASSMPPLSLWRVAVAGLCLGLATITRPTCALPLLVATGWCAAAHWRREGEWPRALGRAATLLVAGLLPVGVVCWANGGQVLIATYGGPNFWLANHPGADGFTTRVPQIHGSPRAGEDYIERFARREAAARLGRPEVSGPEADRFWWREGGRHWLENPLEALLATGRRALFFWQGPEIKNNKDFSFVGAQIPALGLLLGAVSWFWLAPLGAVGLVAGRRCHRPGAGDGVTLLGLVMIAFFVACLPFPITTRYRAPVLPLLCVGAGLAAASLARAIARRHWPRVLVLAGWLVGLGAVTRLDWTGLDRTATARDWWQLGNLAAQRGNAAQGDLALAERAFEEALRRDPSMLEARVNLAQVWIAQGEAERAQSSLARIVAEAPGYPVAWALLGEALLTLGHAASAEQALREALRLDPDHGPALRTLVALLIERGQMMEAAPLAERLATLMPLDPHAWGAVSQTRDALGNTTGAAEARARAEMLRAQTR